MNDRIEIYRSGLRRKLRWRYVAGNGHILADSGQGYSRRIDALRAAARVMGATVVERANGTVLLGKTSDGLDPRQLRVVEVTR